MANDPSEVETIFIAVLEAGSTDRAALLAQRAGDVAESYADPSLAESILGWKAVHGLDDMCRDTWRWQSLNPHGYRESGAQATIRA